MARRSFGATAADFESDQAGNVLSGTGSVWTAQTGGAQITDVVCANGGTGGAIKAAVGSASIPKGMVQFLGPPDDTPVVWADFGGGRVKVVASDGYLTAQSANASYIANVRQYGAFVDGTDVTATMTAAVAAMGVATLVIPSGVYRLSGPVSFGAGQNLQGAGNGSIGGSGTLGPATKFELYDATAGLRFGTTGVAAGTYGGESGGFTIHGRDLASTTGLSLGRTVHRTFTGIDVQNCSINWSVKEAQNVVFNSCQGVNALVDNLVLDEGCGGLVFLRFESRDGGRRNLSMLGTAGTAGTYTVPTGNRFFGCIFEGAGASSDACIYHGGGQDNDFIGCTISLNGAATALPIVKMRQDGAGSSLRLRINGGEMVGEPLYTTAFDLGSTCSVRVSGRTLLNRHLVAFQGASTASVEVDAEIANTTTVQAGGVAPSRVVRTNGVTKDTDLLRVAVALAETMPNRGMGGINSVALPAAGQAYGVKIVLPPSTRVTSITFHAATTALVAGATPHLWYAITDTVGNLLAYTADDTAPPTWAANTRRTANIAFNAAGGAITTWTSASAETAYYLVAMANVTTVPTFIAGSLPAGVAGLAPFRACTFADTGLTTAPPATFGAQTAKTVVAYAYVA